MENTFFKADLRKILSCLKTIWYIKFELGINITRKRKFSSSLICSYFFGLSKIEFLESIYLTHTLLTIAEESIFDYFYYPGKKRYFLFLTDILHAKTKQFILFSNLLLSVWRDERQKCDERRKLEACKANMHHALPRPLGAKSLHSIIYSSLNHSNITEKFQI